MLNFSHGEMDPVVFFGWSYIGENGKSEHRAFIMDQLLLYSIASRTPDVLLVSC